MADFSICTNIKCPRKETCYRFMAIPCHHQPYICVENINYDLCDFFVEIGEKKIRKDVSKFVDDKS